MTRVGVAVWGLGEHARRNIIPALLTCESARLVAVTTRDADVLAETAAATGVVGFLDPDRMLADPSVDAIFLAAPTGLHAHLGHRVIDAGKHLWVEKPLTSEPSDSLALIDRGRQAGLSVLEASMFVFHPQFAAVRRLLEDGAIGEMMSVTARFGFPHLDASNFRYSPVLGGGALLDAGYYPLVAIRRLVRGGVRVLGSAISHPAGQLVDVGGSALVVADSGVTGLADWGFGRAYRNEIDIWGESGALRVERAFSKPPTLETSVVVMMQTGEIFEERIEPSNHFTIMLDRFAEAVVNGTYQTMMLDGELEAQLFADVRSTAKPSET